MRILGVFLVAGLLSFSLGCGGDAGPPKPKLYSVTGKLTLAGKPLADCKIQFVMVGKPGVAYNGNAGVDGSFTLADPQDAARLGAEPGKYKIVLQVSAEMAKNAMMTGGPQSGPPDMTKGAPFPPEYGDAKTTPKEVEVKAESNTIDIAIP